MEWDESLILSHGSLKVNPVVKRDIHGFLLEILYVKKLDYYLYLKVLTHIYNIKFVELIRMQ